MYVFPGITPYFDKAADDAGLSVETPEHGEQRHRARSGWHVKTIVDALSQLPGVVAEVEAGRADKDAPSQALARIALVRKGLAVQVAGLDAAIADVTANLGLDAAPKQPKKPAKP